MGKMKDIYPEKYALQLAIQKLPEYRRLDGILGHTLPIKPPRTVCAKSNIGKV